MAKNRPFYLDQQVRRYDLLYRQSTTSPLINAMMVTTFVFFGWKTVPHAVLSSWAAALAILSLLRIFSTWRWSKTHALIESEAHLKKWVRFLVVQVGVVGFFYGVMGALAALYLNGIPEVCIGMVVLGTASASVANYSLSLACSLAFLLPATLVWALGPLWMGGVEYYIMAFLILFFCVIQIRQVFNWSRFTVRSLETNFELHEKEERLRHNRDASGAIDWDWNVTTDEFTCEGNLEYLFGTRASVFRGTRRDYLEHIHPADRENLIQAMDHAMESGTLDIEHRVIWPDGKTHFIVMRGRLQTDESALPSRLTGISWNITAKKVEEQLRHERDLYEAADRAKLMFLANASHEIRTPLSAINGFAELVLGRPELPTIIQDDLKIILRNGRYLASIVNDLLDLSKSEADHLYIQKSTMTPMREISDSLLVIQSSARKKGLDVKTVYENPIPESIYSDPTRFRQILINMLTNAVKYTEKGTIVIRVSNIEKDQKNFLRIVVSDTGIGINEDTRKNLFQPFVRGQNLEVQRVSGSGLGLALSRSLARKMGGDLRLLSSQEAGSPSGSHFEFTVETGPLAGVRLIQGNTDGSDAAENEISDTQTPRLQGQVLLLAEDQADLRELMSRYLEKHGAKVVTCTDGAEAVSEALKGNYDVVLMDIQMPVMDGYQATSLLRERGYDKPIVALTAHASNLDRQKCYEVGCNFYLSKPVNISYLLDVLTRRKQDGSWPEDPNRTAHT